VKQVRGAGCARSCNRLRGSALLASLLLIQYDAGAEVPVDRIPNSLSLPAVYPSSWVFVYAASYNISIGSFDIIDVAADTKEYKGQFQGAFYPSLIDPAASPELYVADTYFEKGSYGKRTDVLAILDKSHLEEVGEVILPAQKRAVMEEGIRMDMTRDGAFMLILNFTPASSVTVVDLHHRQVANEVPIPGCTSIYPNGARSFSSLCENGSMVTFTLGESGKVVHESRSESFNDIDHDTLYMEPARGSSINYFVTAKGNVRPVDMSGAAPTILPMWPLMTHEEAADGWRTAPGVTGSLQTLDKRGRLYVAVSRDTGYEGPLWIGRNTEVWVYDVHSQKRVGRIPLKNGATSIDVTQGETPYLVAVAGGGANAGTSLDVYNASTAYFVRTIGGWWPGVSLVLDQSRR
jgi:methylamine dehydrogenase heavy chain